MTKNRVKRFRNDIQTLLNAVVRFSEEPDGWLVFLGQSFHPNVDVSLDRRFQEIRAVPLLLLDDLKESSSGSAWMEDRLHGLLNYRFNMHQPTVLTSALDADSFALSYPSFWKKLSDPSTCQIVSIYMPPYRRANPTYQGKREN